ncbi:MAG: flagellar hook-basal body complex protein FliE [Myxococcales bacterium]
MSIETMRSIGSAGAEQLQSDGVGQVDRSLKSASGSGFAETLGGALQKVDQMQVDADVQAEKVAMGGGNLHEMSLALEKADVSMRLAMKVRNKLIDAYQEIMRMSV